MESFEATGNFSGAGDSSTGIVDLEMVFIRAPRICRSGPQVQSLAEYGGDCVMAQHNRIAVATFHPELTDDETVHAYFMHL